MASDHTLTGKCLCGAVGVTGTAKKADVTACHCGMCRRWSSGPYFAVSCGDVVFEGAQNITTIRSSDWAERGFCGKCGSNLFYHIVDSDEYEISAGLIDDPSQLRLSLQVYIDSKPDFYSLAEKTKTMTGDEVYAAYAPPPE